MDTDKLFQIPALVVLIRYVPLLLLMLLREILHGSSASVSIPTQHESNNLMIYLIPLSTTLQILLLNLYLDKSPQNLMVTDHG